MSRRRTPASPRIARLRDGSVQADRLLRVWCRVLERRLRRRLGTKVVVEIHDNTHTMVTFHWDRRVLYLRLHHMFLAAGEETLAALVAYVRAGDLSASAALDRFIERNRAFIRRVSVEKLRSRVRLAPVGRVHDLQRIFHQLNRRYFQNRIEAQITYGPAPKGRGPRKSIKMGSYSADARLIRIHPALDQLDVPRYFVEWIVFHEMLHHVHRVRRGEDGRRCVHSAAFMEDERSFHDYHRARRWEDENLDLLLKARAVTPVETLRRAS